jgi:hypothetical protein
MKTFFFLISLTFTSIAFSQGNLQFNQVKLVSNQETVPNGKVWKVENAIYSGGTVFCVGQALYQSCGTSSHSPVIYGLMEFKIDGISNYIPLSNNGLSQSIFPFWLPAGKSLTASTNMRYLSVIEFNIIP